MTHIKPMPAIVIMASLAIATITAIGQSPGYKVNIVATGGAKYVVIDPRGREVSSHSTQHAAEAVAIAGSLNDAGQTYFVRQSLELRVSATGPVVPPKPPVDPPVEPEPPVVIPDPPPVVPLPTDSAILPITLPNGEQWSGLTPAPPTTFRTDHPRLLVNADTLPALREKLEHPSYALDVAAVKASTNPSDWALCYMVWGDEEKGLAAIPKLLAWDFPRWYLGEDHGTMIQGVLMYDWLHNLMTPEQRVQAIEVIRTKVPAPATATRYFWTSYLVRGPVPALMAALAIDDELAEQQRRDLLDPAFRGLKLYGGLLDILTCNALQNGGNWHAGGMANILHGYEGSFAIHGPPFVLKSWQTTTGQNPFDQTTYYDRMPYDVLCARKGIQEPPSGEGKACLEYITGMDVGDDARGLAAWLLTQPGFERIDNGNPLRQFRMLLGDRRVQPKSPEELGIPLFGYQDGANAVYVRSSWSDEAFKCLFFARAWDRGRYEQTASSIAIHKGDRLILPLDTNWKAIARKGYTSLRVFDAAGDLNQKKTYGSSKEPKYPEQLVDPARTFNRPETLTSLSEADGIVTAVCRFEHLLPVRTPPEVCQRTVEIDPQAETVVVRDYVAGLRSDHTCLITFGLSEVPVIAGNVIETSEVRITIQSAFDSILWDDSDAESDPRGSQWTVGTVKIAPTVSGGAVNSMILVEVK